ncbi:hypothetical protein Acsp05_63430 [Actinokineospora sp. NBRC 105648]|nr:hypothetical protein Acsp05_63430 [Actinokineospora sp. NBRC 105648]
MSVAELPTTPAPTKLRSVPAPTAAPPGQDLEELARRLLDPLSRLLRADIRQARDRAGRPYDR